MAMRPGSLYQLTFPEISIRQCVSLFSARRSPTWFRWRKSGRRAESESGGDGLLANPRSRPTPLSDVRTPTSESVGWLLLLFDTEKQGKKFFMYFWGQKYQKPPHVVFRGSARAAALHGARKIRPMRHPVADAPQLAPSFSASNESADLLCRQRRHYMACASHSFFPQGDPRLGSDGEKADGGLKARAAGTVCLQTRAVARRRFQTSGRRHRNRSGGFCCFSTPKSREKSFFRRFFRKPKKDVERLFAAFRHRKAEKKERVFQAFFCKEQKDIGRLLATYTRKKQSTKNTTLQQGSYTFDLPRKQPPSSP